MSSQTGNSVVLGIKHEDVVPCAQFKLPKGSYRGEFHDSSRSYVGNLYLVDGKVYIARPKPYGRGELIEMYPETLSPKLFCKSGGYQLYASTWVQFYQLKAAENA